MSHYYINSHVKITKDGDFYLINCDKPIDHIQNELNNLIPQSTWQKKEFIDVFDKKITLNSGLYVFAITDTRDNKNYIAYIGCSNNLLIRLFSHPILRFMQNALSPVYKSYIFLYETINHKKEESSYIFHFKPFLNSKIYPNRVRIEYKKQYRAEKRRLKTHGE